MMESLRSATRNTGFERWLDATIRPHADAHASSAAPEQAPPAHARAGELPHAEAGCACHPSSTLQEQQQHASGSDRDSGGLAEVADYLAGGSGAASRGQQQQQQQSVQAQAGVFRPGWEDIFRMNQKQLEVRSFPQHHAFLLTLARCNSP
jgi:hypothetical protein